MLINTAKSILRSLMIYKSISLDFYAKDGQNKVTEKYDLEQPT